MNKAELVAHLANLTFVMDFHEKLGTTKNPHIVAEFHRAHEEFVSMLRKEQENEAGSRKRIGYAGSEDRAQIEGGIPRRSIEYREQGRDGSSRDAIGYGSRV